MLSMHVRKKARNIGRTSESQVSQKFCQRCLSHCICCVRCGIQVSDVLYATVRGWEGGGWAAKWFGFDYDPTIGDDVISSPDRINIFQWASLAHCFSLLKHSQSPANLQQPQSNWTSSAYWSVVCFVLLVPTRVCVCVCVRAQAYVRAIRCVCVCVCARTIRCVCVCVCVMMMMMMMMTMTKWVYP